MSKEQLKSLKIRTTQMCGCVPELLWMRALNPRKNTQFSPHAGCATHFSRRGGEKPRGGGGRGRRGGSADCGRGVNNAPRGKEGAVGRSAVRRGTDCQLRRAALVPCAGGGYAADFGEGEEMLTLERALRCCESLPGDGGWPINWDAVAAIAQHSAPPLQQHKILRF